jgi:hypothetical protein
MTIYYDYNDFGEMIQVSEKERRVSGGFKHLSESKVLEYSEGKFKESGWLISDTVKAPSHYSSYDSMGGVNGIFNPADGKRYDSRSAYISAVKAKGLEIIGDDAPKTVSRPKVNDIDWRPAVAETLKQLKSTKKRGKR